MALFSFLLFQWNSPRRFSVTNLVHFLRFLYTFLLLLNQSSNAFRDVWLQTNGFWHPKALITAYSANYCKEALALGSNGIRMLVRALTRHCGLNKRDRAIIDSATKRISLLCIFFHSATLYGRTKVHAGKAHVTTRVYQHCRSHASSILINSSIHPHLFQVPNCQPAGELC